MWKTAVHTARAARSLFEFTAIGASEIHRQLPRSSSHHGVHSQVAAPQGVARMSSTQSKAEYLKRYLDGGGTDASEQKRDKKEHKHKKHKRHHHHHHSGMRVIDADEVVAAGGREIYDEDEEEKPQLDEAAAALVAAHTAQRATSAAAPRSAPVSQWEEVPIGKSKRTLHDSPDPSPPRRRPADDRSVGAVSSVAPSAPRPMASSSKMMPPPPPPPPPLRDAAGAASSSSSARGTMIDSASSTALAAPGLHTHFASQSSAAAEALRGESASAADAMAMGACKSTMDLWMRLPIPLIATMMATMIATMIATDCHQVPLDESASDCD